MGNQITEHYFNEDFVALRKERVESILQNIAKETGFKFKKVLAEKTIYTKDKIQSVETQSEFQGKSVILKIQGLKLNIEEFGRFVNAPA